MTDGLYKDFDEEIYDRPLMVLDDLTEMFGVSQDDYKFMDGALANPLGVRPRDKFGRSEPRR